MLVSDRWWPYRVRLGVFLPLQVFGRVSEVVIVVQFLGHVKLFVNIGLPCPSFSSRVCSNSCPLSPWCHPNILSSVTPFSFCSQSLSAWGSFPMNWLFKSGDQSTGASASASVLPISFQDWFPLGLTGLIFLMSKGLSRVFSSTTV